MPQPDPYTAIEHMQDAEAVLSEWEIRFGSSFPSLRPFLLQGSRKALFYPCPDCGSSLRVAELPDDGAFALHDGFHCCNDIQLATSDRHTFSLNLRRWLEKLGKSLSVENAVRQLSASIWRMGSVRISRQRHPVYFLTASAGEYLPLAMQVCSMADCPALIFSPRYCQDTADWLQQKPHGYVPLSDHVEFSTMEPLSNYKPMLDQFRAQLDSGEAISREEVGSVLSIAERLDDKPSIRPPNHMTVLRLYCLEGLSTKKIARQCSCSTGTVMNRKNALEAKLGQPLAVFRQYGDMFEDTLAVMNDSRAKRINARAMIYDDGGFDDK